MFNESSHLTTNHTSLTTTNIHSPHLNLHHNTTTNNKYTHTSSKISDYRLRLTCLDSTLLVLQRRNSVSSSQPSHRSKQHPTNNIHNSTHTIQTYTSKISSTQNIAHPRLLTHWIYPARTCLRDLGRYNVVMDFQE